MKKYLPYANYIVAGAGALGALLRFWQLSAGTDSKGLYPTDHPGWIGWLALTVATLVIIYLLTRQSGDEPQWQPNFPGGIFPVLGHLLAACGIALFSISQWTTSDALGFISCSLGLFSAVLLLVMAWQQRLGSPPMSMGYLLPCLFFAAQLFLIGKASSIETEHARFLSQFLAIAASCLACYQLWGFAVGSGNREKSLFWSLSAAYLCLSAAPGTHVMYAALGLWHLLSHCALTPIPAAPEETSEIPEETEEFPSENSEM